MGEKRLECLIPIKSIRSDKPSIELMQFIDRIATIVERRFNILM